MAKKTRIKGCKVCRNQPHFWRTLLRSLAKKRVESTLKKTSQAVLVDLCETVVYRGGKKAPPNHRQKIENQAATRMKYKLRE